MIKIFILLFIDFKQGIKIPMTFNVVIIIVKFSKDIIILIYSDNSFSNLSYKSFYYSCKLIMKKIVVTGGSGFIEQILLIFS